MALLERTVSSGVSKGDSSFSVVLLTLSFCTHRSRALPSGTSSLGVEGLFSRAGLEVAKVVQCFQVHVVF